MLTFNPFELHKIDINDLIDCKGNDDQNDFPYTTAYDFLMGSCHLFALALYRKFGYKICEIRDSHNNLTHSFCVVKNDLQTFFIDVRGATIDFKEFISYFSTTITTRDIHPLGTQDEVQLKDKWDIIGLQFANAIIEKYPECYTI